MACKALHDLVLAYFPTSFYFTIPHVYHTLGIHQGLCTYHSLCWKLFLLIHLISEMYESTFVAVVHLYICTSVDVWEYICLHKYICSIFLFYFILFDSFIVLTTIYKCLHIYLFIPTSLIQQLPLREAGTLHIVSLYS